MTNGWANIQAGDSFASSYPRKLYDDLAKKAGVPSGSEIPLAFQEAEIQGIGMVDHRPELIGMTKWDKRVDIVNQRADGAGVARPELDRVVITGNRGAGGAFNREVKSARKQLLVARKPDGSLRARVQEMRERCDGTSNNGRIYRESINGAGKEFKGRGWAIAIDEHSVFMASNQALSDAGDPNAVERLGPDAPRS